MGADVQLLWQVDKTTLKTRSFQEACICCVVEELAEHLAQWSYSPAFFELSFVPLVRLRSFCKCTDVDRFRREIKELIRQVSYFFWIMRSAITVIVNSAEALFWIIMHFSVSFFTGRSQLWVYKFQACDCWLLTKWSGSWILSQGMHHTQLVFFFFLVLFYIILQYYDDTLYCTRLKRSLGPALFLSFLLCCAKGLNRGMTQWLNLGWIFSYIQ